MKKLLLILAVALAALPMKAYDFSEKNKEGVELYYTITNEDAAFCEVSPAPVAYSAEIIYIPESAHGPNGRLYSIRGIGVKAFIGCTSVRLVYIPGKTTYIGASAFEESGLQSFELPCDVKLIGDRAFADCANFTSYFKIEEDVPGDIKMGENVFENLNFSKCYLLVPKGSKSAFQAADQWKNFTDFRESDFNFMSGYYDRYAFRIIDEEAKTCEMVSRNPYFNSYPNVLLDSDIYRRGDYYTLIGIGDFAMGWVTNIEAVVLPKSVTYIGQSAFEGCTALNTAWIPSAVTKMDDSAFYGCSNLTKIFCESHHPENIEMGYNVFGEVNTSSCTLVVPPSCIDKYDCDQWKDFVKVEPNTYDFRISYLAFKIEGSECYIAEMTKWNGKEAYSGHVFDIPAAVVFEGEVYDVKGIEPYAFENSVIDDVTLPAVRNIEKCAFRNSTIKHIDLPECLKYILAEAFSQCKDMESIVCHVQDPNNVFVSNNAFDGMNYDTCTLFVPKGSVDLYRAAAPWNKFSNILEIESGIDTVAADAASDAPAVYYNLSGVAMPAGDLAPGLYIRRQGTQAEKVLIK